MLVNKTFDEIKIGDSAAIDRTLTRHDILAFAGASGDVNPAHLDREYARTTVFEDVIGHGLWTGALVSAVLGTRLPGPGAIYLNQSFQFLTPVRIGDTLYVSVTVTSKVEDTRHVILACEVTNQHAQKVLTGEARVQAPARRVEIETPAAPILLLSERGDRLVVLIDRARQNPPLACAVVHPVNDVSLRGALESRGAGLIEPVLVGPKEKIHAAAAEAALDLSGLEIVDAPHSHAAGEIAADLASQRRVAAIMKGALHTDEVLEPVLDPKRRLRTERRLSHVFVLDAPSYHKLLLITDAAVNIAPTLMHKADILQNAIDLAHALGVSTPKAAILSAVETVTSAIASTVDAAALCKMADRGQITGALVDGPLAFDNAVSAEAVRLKGLSSAVAGDADILLAPELVSGNMIAKQLDYLGGAVAAGLVLGAHVPIILTSRAEGVLPRKASCALASLFANQSG